MSGIRIHPRTRPVAQAKLELTKFLIEFESKHGLTAAEVTKMLAQEIASQMVYAIRMERHGTTTKKGDEA